MRANEYIVHQQEKMACICHQARSNLSDDQLYEPVIIEYIQKSVMSMISSVVSVYRSITYCNHDHLLAPGNKQQFGIYHQLSYTTAFFSQSIQFHSPNISPCGAYSVTRHIRCSVSITWKLHRRKHRKHKITNEY